MLKESRWRENGYALFGISTLAQSSRGGFLGSVPSEFSWVALPREDFCSLGGFDKRFQSPGGGLVNQHFRDRAVFRPETNLVALLGEGVFHQVHGGVATNVAIQDNPIGQFRVEYRDIVGQEYTEKSVLTPLYFGHLPQAARGFL